MKFLLKLMLVIIILIIAGLSYIGVVPVLSAPFNKPKDLGMTANPQLVYDLEKKYEPMTQGQQKVDVDLSLSSQEITSVFAVWQERDKNMPLKNVQVKFNPDGTGEASGIISLPVVISLAKNLGYSDSDIEKGKQYVTFVNGDLPFYVKGTGGMTNNQLTMNPQTLQIGKVTVPSEIVAPLKSAVTDMVNRRIDQIGGADIREAHFRDGTFHLDGTVPSTIKYD